MWLTSVFEGSAKRLNQIGNSMYLLCTRSSLNMCELNRRLYGKFLLLSLFIYLCGIQNALIILFRSLTPSLSSFKKNMMSSSCFGLDRSSSINYIGKFIAGTKEEKKYSNKVQATLTLKPFPKVTQNVCFLFSSYIFIFTLSSGLNRSIFGTIHKTQNKLRAFSSSFAI